MGHSQGTDQGTVDRSGPVGAQSGDRSGHSGQIRASQGIDQGTVDRSGPVGAQSRDRSRPVWGTVRGQISACMGYSQGIDQGLYGAQSGDRSGPVGAQSGDRSGPVWGTVRGQIRACRGTVRG